ncbi:MAG: HAMP domain-containing histidine kinase [Mycobacterium sp.]|nr:HAMP domain-containing histidine kinase [Mycobacterium sp.]
MTLLRQLVIGVSLVVSTAVMGVGAAAVMSLRNEVVSLSDAQVANSLSAFGYSYAKARRGEIITFPGQAPGTVIALLGDGAPVLSASFGDGEPAPAPPGALAALGSINWANGDRQTVDLGDLGPHRVGSREVAGGERLVSAVSLEDAHRTLRHNTIIVVGLVLLALLVTAAGTVAVVRYALRPLRRVAAIAEHVASLPLEASEYRISARVDDRDTDPETEVGTVGHTLNKMLDHVDSALTGMAESDRRMKQFLTDASHELRTPLAAILGYAELTRQESEILPPMTEYALERIEAESRRMSTLVSDLLLLSRLDEGHDLQSELLDLCDLVADAVNDAAVTAPEHRFASDLPEHPVVLRGDRVRLQQLVANLLANARIHTPAGTTVTASVVDHGPAAVELTVADDGPGIPASIMPNLFGRFVRADKARSREMGSSGLGLAIVASIVEAHGGTVTAESVPGRTVFTVLLPAQR